MAKTRFTSVSEYIASKPRDARVALERVRAAIRKAVPKAEEGLSYQMPVFTLEGAPVLYFAVWKAHYSIYPASTALAEAFERELAPYQRSKGAIRFPLSEAVPVKLIERIARFRARQLTTRETRKGGRTKGPEGQLGRIRRLAAALPSVFEKLSHGAPTFFVQKDKGVFAVFADNHHDDGRVALWVPVRDGLQPLLIEDAPGVYFKPPYVGPSGWVGIRLDQVRDDALQAHLREAWELVANGRKRPRARPAR